MNAAGRTLVKSELLDSFAGLRDDDPISLNGMPVIRADDNGALHTEDDPWDQLDEESQGAFDLLERIVTGKMTKAEILTTVKEFLA